MISKRRIYLLAILLMVFFGVVIFAFVKQSDKTYEYKGTLVKGYSQEVLL